MSVLRKIIVTAISYTVLSASILISISSPSHAQSEQAVLTILNWSEYLSPEVVHEFEKRYHVKVNNSYYETDDERDKMLLRTNGRGYDLGIVSGEMLATYRQKDWLAPIDNQQVPNLKYVHLDVDENYSKGFSVPFTWGTLGIAYRQDLVSESIKSWKDLLQPKADMQGKIIMIKSSRELLGAALKAMNFSVNSMEEIELELAGKLLEQQKPSVFRYGYIDLNEEGDLVTGRAAVSMAYNGDFLALQELEPKLKYIIPEEGTVVWVDHWVVYKASTNKELAYQFLNFINQPEQAAKCAEYAYMAPANSAALNFLPKEFLDNEIIFPSAKQLKNSEIFEPLSGRMLRTRSRIFNQIIH